MDKCHAYLDRAIAERGIKRETFLGRKGDVFIWSCQIAHGGSPIKDQKRTRKSLVTHYWRANDMARHKLEPESGGYYFAKDHKPVPSEPANSFRPSANVISRAFILLVPSFAR